MTQPWLQRPPAGWLDPHRRGLVLVFAILVMAFVALAALAVMRPVPQGAEAAFGNSIAEAGGRQVALALATAGNTAVTVVLVLVVGGAFWWANRGPDGFVLCAAAAITTVLVAVVKVIVARPRPTDALVVEATDPYAFPSGHAARAAVLAVLLVLLILRRSRRPEAVAGGAVAGIAWTAAMAWGRLVLRVHFLSDVVAGILLGLGVGLAMVPLLDILDAQHASALGRVLWRKGDPRDDPAVA